MSRPRGANRRAGARRRRRRVGAWLVRLAPLVAWILRALAASWRVRFDGAKPWAEPDARLGALWHRNLIAAAGVFRDRPLQVTVSRSRDGDMAVAVMGHLGFAEPPRGSSRTGGVSLLRAVSRAVESGAQVVVPVDGPVGPARRAKPGVLQVAMRAQIPIYTVAFSARPCLHLRSWDRMLLPLPFARVVCCYGEPFRVPPVARGEELESVRAELDARLDALTTRADTLVGIPPKPEARSGHFEG